MYRNSRLAILLPILLAAAVVLGLLLGRYLGRNTPEAQLRNLVEQLTHPTNKLAYTLSLIETEYVDSVSMDSLSEQVIPLLMEELDPHSVYIPKSEMEAVNEPLQGTNLSKGSSTASAWSSTWRPTRSSYSMSSLRGRATRPE